MHDPAEARQKLEARGAWPADQVVDRMMEAVSTGAPFYIICPGEIYSVPSVLLACPLACPYLVHEPNHC